MPVTVWYALTDLGRSLNELAEGLRAWAQDNMRDVLANREAYDRLVTTERSSSTP